MDIRIRQLREAADLTQEQLSGLSGLSQQAISHIESGRRKNMRFAPLRMTTGCAIA